jgi:hypothetical protein
MTSSFLFKGGLLEKWGGGAKMLLLHDSVYEHQDYLEAAVEGFHSMQILMEKLDRVAISLTRRNNAPGFSNNKRFHPSDAFWYLVSSVRAYSVSWKVCYLGIFFRPSFKEYFGVMRNILLIYIFSFILLQALER